jgi:hypothetical protein
MGRLVDELRRVDGLTMPVGVAVSVEGVQVREGSTVPWIDHRDSGEVPAREPDVDLLEVAIEAWDFEADTVHGNGPVAAALSTYKLLTKRRA